MLLAGCGADRGPLIVPPELLQPCPGWQGPPPSTERAFARAAAAELAGRVCANTKLAGIKQIVGAQ
jgi:hypothetical protein